jgi:vacuolar protein sorting-associated protein 45
VNARKLLTVSALEQELVCGPAGASEHQDAYDKLAKLMEDGEVQFSDKLRCVILYALRYEHAPNNLPQLRGLLRAHARLAGYSEHIVDTVDKVLGLSGSHTRTWPLFAQDSDALSLKSVVKSIQTGVKGIENIYTQHRSIMHGVLTNLFAGELKTMQFPFAESGNVKTSVECRCQRDAVIERGRTLQGDAHSCPVYVVVLLRTVSTAA